MTIKWNSRFNVGHAAIDAEHKLLLTTINALETSLRHPEDKEPLLFFVDQLYEFSIAHFRYEEALQLKHLYPFREDNVKGHEQLVQDLEQIQNNIHQIAKKPTLSVTDIAELHQHIKYLANNWLMTHILKEDLRMKGFMGGGDG
ncbi:MAG: hemerythrin domain-containing protein [Methylococcaceae bacterium]